MIDARYDRRLDSELVDYLKIGGQLDFILHGSHVSADEPYALDVQLREKNKIMYYRGTTRLLVVTLLPHEDELPTFTVQADKFYKGNPTCATFFVKLVKLGKTSPAEAKTTFQKYLSAASTIAPKSHYENQAEGYWQNRICQRFGPDCRADDPWLVIDRECVIGFESSCAKNAFFTPILKDYRSLCQKIADVDRGDRWRQTIIGKGLGDELDMLAVAPNGDLLAIELKYGTNANGIYWGPVQVGVYTQAFTQQLDNLGPAVVDLVKQKIMLGLLPEHALDRLPFGGFRRVRPVLAVAKANARSGCWSKLADVMDHVGGVEVVTVGKKNADHVDLPYVKASHVSVDH